MLLILLQAVYSNFEIFHVSVKQVPVDIVELKEQVSWLNIVYYIFVLNFFHISLSIKF